MRVAPKKNYTNTGIWQLKYINPPFLKEKIQDMTSFHPQVQNALLTSYSGHANTIACKGICCTYGWNDSLQNIFLITMNYAQNIIFYQFFL